MRKRCLNESDPNFPNYGERGIRVCDRWLSFENFLADMGHPPTNEHSIDRFPDNDGNYEPGNCRWATRMEQAQNKRDNVIIEIDGVRKCVAEWAREKGILDKTIYERLKMGWSRESAVLTPVNSKERITSCSRVLVS